MNDMELRFNIHYRTAPGEELALHLEGATGKASCRMTTVDGEHWACRVALSEECVGEPLRYAFSVCREEQQVRCEWAAMRHQVELSARRAGVYTLYCQWSEAPEDAPLYSSAFTRCLRHRRVEPLGASAFGRTVRLLVRAPQLGAGRRLGIVGAEEELGKWDPAHAVRMTEHAPNEWAVDLDAEAFPQGRIECKFVDLGEEGDTAPAWEEGMNRILELPWMAPGELVAYELPQAAFAHPKERLAGTLVPLFSLRSRNGFGVGDFNDLRRMIDFASATRQRVLQILPINDTTATHTWTDSYPYSCVSVFALHPQYADLRQLPSLRDEQLRKSLEQERILLNELPQIDYERVNKAKLTYLKALFEQQEGKEMMKGNRFAEFFEQEQQWLVPYARYCTLRDKHATTHFTDRGKHATWDERERTKLSNPRTKAYQEVAFHYFLQFILYTQMQGVHQYARERGVILKGDIPIGVNRNGCDVWTDPKYFNLDGQAGAPPDDFSQNGQNWEFPTYNWEEMQRDAYTWWKKRFQNMEKFFDAYRIDHVLGFFRIWEIPRNAVHGLLGQFLPAIPLSREEIEAYGIQFQEEKLLKPIITEEILEQIFGKSAPEVKETYLNPSEGETWQLKPQYDTQRKIEEAFKDKECEQDRKIRDGLYRLVSNVLFLRDRRQPEAFHPRIAAQKDSAYQLLSQREQEAFNRLYNDYYYRRNDRFWYEEAMRKLPEILSATRMLACAEDLGMVPRCVPWVMDQLRILSLEIQAMPKDPSTRFGYLSRNPYRSVSTISTHDMPTLRQWWDEDHERAQDYYATMLNRGGIAPHPLPGWLARDIVSRHLESPSMLCILTIQDWLAIDERLRLPDADAERVNIPADPHHYWRYRMHLCIEDLIEDKEFKQHVTELVLQAGRR